MKRLSKFQIHSEKQMKDEELLLLRGGYDVENCGVSCSKDSDCQGGKCPKCHETAGGWPRPMCDAM